MTANPRHAQVDFIRLDGHAVRVTSWQADLNANTWHLVTITRGSRDAELLDQLLNQDEITLEVAGEGAFQVAALEIERREFGEGQSGIARFAVIFGQPGVAPSRIAKSPARSIEVRISALETEVEELRKLVHNIAEHGK